jgi:hypothetical protein
MEINLSALVSGFLMHARENSSLIYVDAAEVNSLDCRLSAA